MRLQLYRLAILLAFLVLWQFASGRLINVLFISAPTEIAAQLWQWIVDGSLFYHAGITATEAFLGFLIGATAGMALGVLLGRAKHLADLLNPFIMAFYSLPKIALAPLFIIWFGIGMDMKIILTAVVVFFLVFLNTYTGVRGVSQELVAILRLMGASEQHVLRKVVLPSAVVWVFAGLRLSVPYAIIGAIVGEMIASNRGLGYLLTYSSNQFNTAGVFAAIVAVILLSAILNICVDMLSRAAMPWQKVDEQREVAI